MKKIACLLTCLCITLVVTLPVAAKESTVSLPQESITLEEKATSIEMAVDITPENQYAGIEIAVSCPESVAVTASSSTSGSMSASPVLADGLYWTSFFESSNKLTGTMKITLQLSCPETWEGDIVIEEVHVLTKDGAGVSTEKLKPSQTIHVSREGANLPSSSQTSENAGNTEDSSANSGGDVPQTGAPVWQLTLIGAGLLSVVIIIVIEISRRKRSHAAK